MFSTSPNSVLQRVDLIVLVGAVTIVTYDFIGATLARRERFSFSRLLVGSFLIDLFTGYFVARASTTAAAMAGSALVGFVDATIGWMITWRIGPGRPKVRTTHLSIALTVLLMTVMAALLGLVGAFMTK